MKKLLMAVIVLVSLAACKKDKTGNATPQFTKKIISFNYDNNVKADMQYSAEGRIISLTGNISSTTYQYAPAFLMKYTQSNFYAEIKNTTADASGRIIKGEKWADGSFRSKMEYSYNAQGYLTSMKEIRPDYTYVTNYEYLQGNCTAIKMFKDGVSDYTYDLEYYTEKPNPLKLDLLDTRITGFIVDHTFGKLNTHLLKRWKGYNPQNQLIKDNLYSYTMDAQGYPVKIELKTMNGTTVTGLYQFQ